MKLSIIIPLFNEEGNIRPLLTELRDVLAHVHHAEVIVVNDGSTDGSRDILKAAVQEFHFLKVVELRRNYGQTAAIVAGMEIATGEILLPMDADGQNDPHDIPMFLAKIDEGFDIVSGWRKKRKDAWLRSLLSRIANRLIRAASGQDIHDYGCTMKAYKRTVIEDIGLYGDMHRFMAAYAAVNGVDVAEVVVHHRPRVHGSSKYGFGRIWKVILDLFLLTFFLRSFTRPMQFFGAIGLLSIFFGFLTILGAFGWKEFGGPTFIQTPLPVLAALFVIVGVQCILMGVLAEMQMRTYFQSRKSYIVRAVLSHSHS